MRSGVSVPVRLVRTDWLREYSQLVMRKIPALLICLALSADCFGQSQSSDTPAQSAAPSPSLAEAARKLEHGLNQEAIQMLLQLTSANPPVKGANRELGIAYYRSSKLVEAEKSFAAAMAEDPSDIESIQMRGLTLYRLGRPGDAIPFLEKVRQWTPDANADANYVLGLCYMNAQRYEDASKAFAAQYGVDPSSAAAQLLAAQMFSHANLPDLASEKAKAALKLSPNIPLAHFLLGEVALSGIRSSSRAGAVRNGARNQPIVRSCVRQAGGCLCQDGPVSTGAGIFNQGNLARSIVYRAIHSYGKSFSATKRSSNCIVVLAACAKDGSRQLHHAHFCWGRLIRVWVRMRMRNVSSRLHRKSTPPRS